MKFSDTIIYGNRLTAVGTLILPDGRTRERKWCNAGGISAEIPVISQRGVGNLFDAIDENLDTVHFRIIESIGDNRIEDLADEKIFWDGSENNRYGRWDDV
ncbi:MAG: hypothetical protein R3C26_10260 [Calditrichia bacterium]